MQIIRNEQSDKAERSHQKECILFDNLPMYVIDAFRCIGTVTEGNNYRGSVRDSVIMMDQRADIKKKVNF